MNISKANFKYSSLRFTYNQNTTDSTIALRYGLLPTHLNINWTQLKTKIKSSDNLYIVL